MEIRAFWVDIEDGSGNRIGSGPLRVRSFTRRGLLSASGEFSFDLSMMDPNLAALQEKRVAVCRYINKSGSVLVFGGGIIDKITVDIDSTGLLACTVSGNDLTRELTYRSVGALMLASGSAGVTDGPSQIMALAPAGWSLSGGTTAAPVYAGFDGESVLNAICKVGEHIGEHWRLGSGRQVAWLGPASGFASSGIRAVQHVNDPIAAESAAGIVIISSLQEESDAAEILTRVIPRGSGNGSAIVTLAAATASAPAGFTLNKPENFISLAASESTYGRIERVIDFKELGPLSNTTLDVQNAANMLLQASAEYLRRYGAPKKFYTVELAMANQLLEPGTTIRIVYRALLDGAVIYDLDGTFNIIEVENSIDETGLHTERIVISTIDRQPTGDAEYLAGEAESAKVFAAHQQLGASVDNLNWQDEMDKDHASSFRFWLGEEYTTIQRATFRFRIEPLRSTIKSVGTSSSTSSAAGASTNTSSSGGGSTTTSSSGGAQTSTAAAPNSVITVHDGVYEHDLGVVHGAGGIAALYAQTAVGDLNLEVGQTSHSHDISDHTHSVTVAGHTHSVSISDHTHTVTPVLTTAYGIFEESTANTLQLSDLVIKLNGGSDLNSQVTDIGSGWLALDITAGLVSSIFRPNQENNELVISTATADKTARIEAQLTIRGVVQAIAYS